MSEANPIRESAPDMARRTEIAENLAKVRARMAAACAASGRDITELTLIAVTKNLPATDIAHLTSLGVNDIGESRDQEASAKVPVASAAGLVVRWHYIGKLQRNKCRAVAGYADLVHSVDSIRLCDALNGGAERHRGKSLDVLVQVTVDGDSTRGGAVCSSAGIHNNDPNRDLDRVLERLANATSLTLRGLMAVAPLSWKADHAFAALATVAARVRKDHPNVNVISAGMSADLEAAIAYGATHIRVGTALLGSRELLAQLRPKYPHIDL